jgi:hypothetical protein
MKKKGWLRIRIDDDLLKKYKVLCVKNDLSIPKQTHSLIKNFVFVQEENLKIMDECNGKN